MTDSKSFADPLDDDQKGQVETAKKEKPQCFDCQWFTEFLDKESYPPLSEKLIAKTKLLPSDQVALAAQSLSSVLALEEDSVREIALEVLKELSRDSSRWSCDMTKTLTAKLEPLIQRESSDLQPFVVREVLLLQSKCNGLLKVDKVIAKVTSPNVRGSTIMATLLVLQDSGVTPEPSWIMKLLDHKSYEVRVMAFEWLMEHAKVSDDKLEPVIRKALSLSPFELRTVAVRAALQLNGEVFRKLMPAIKTNCDKASESDLIEVCKQALAKSEKQKGKK